jgi:hypothetical protein
MYTAPAYYTEAPKYYTTEDRGTAHLHIMGKYSVTWSLNMPIIDYLNYIF